ncbi:MAG TPA: dimethylsulfonioproprionate lyase family protein, partial [Candidatus Saccharimonadales bacterium]|nr:dimethylsulfonioproprionate lyase family protein [Candidatus Saccharimonadales bacterium]
MTPIDEVLKLVDVIKARFAERAAVNDAIGQESALVLSLLQPLPPFSGTFSPSRHPAIRHLDAALRPGDSSDPSILEAIHVIAFNLPWQYAYPERADSPRLQEKIAFAEIIGPDAPFRSDHVCLGVTLIGPDTFYPPHRHPATELYLVVAGEATWTAGKASHIES